jgi:transcription initiation factor IIE alpha subunit
MKIGMFGIIPTTILSDKTLSDGDKIMYAILSAHANLERKVMQDDEYFAKLRGVESRTIRSQLSTLVSAGFVYRRKVQGGTELELASETMFGEGKKDLVVRTTESILNYWK